MTSRSVPPSGIASSELRMMFRRTWCIASGSIGDPGQLGRQVRLDQNAGARELSGEGVEDLLDHLIDVPVDPLEVLRPGELEQVGRELLDPVELLDDVLEVLAKRSVDLRADELDRRPDAGQRIADLVGDDGREVADRGEPVEPALELEFPDRLGDVVEGEDPTQHALVPGDRYPPRLDRQLTVLGCDHHVPGHPLPDVRGPEAGPVGRRTNLDDLDDGPLPDLVRLEAEQLLHPPIDEEDLARACRRR